MVKDANSSIRVEPIEGGGTAFVFLWPATFENAKGQEFQNEKVIKKINYSIDCAAPNFIVFVCGIACAGYR